MNDCIKNIETELDMAIIIESITHYSYCDIAGFYSTCCVG